LRFLAASSVEPVIISGLSLRAFLGSPMPPSLLHHFGQLGSDFFSLAQVQPLTAAKLIHCNTPLAQQIGAEVLLKDKNQLLQWASGHAYLDGSDPLAMNYSGHQFGVFNPELGDGRGLLLGEWQDPQGQLWDFHLKGAGRTPYSRFGDGRAVLRSSLREYLVGEALHHLGVNSTRSLCLVCSQEQVVRESIETGAMIVRVSRSHIRFGSFEQFFYQRQYPQLRKLADYTVARYLPDLDKDTDPYQALLQMAVDSSAVMIAHWQAIGFCHGVMNTDNMSIIGDTFDFGPFAFLDEYNPANICNHSDHQGRYAFNRQPNVALWNLNALAHALSPLLDADKIKNCLLSYQGKLQQHYSRLMANKLGLDSVSQDNDKLVAEWLELLTENQADYHRSFRQLSQIHSQQPSGELKQLLAGEQPQAWLQRYRQALQTQDLSAQQSAQLMDKSNPIYVLRNHLLQTAIEQAEQGDYREIERLFQLLSQPFTEQPGMDHYRQGPKLENKTGPLSCSS